AVERDGQERHRDHVGQQRRVGQHPAAADAHAADRKGGQRADGEGQRRDGDTDEEAVAHLVPERLEQPVGLPEYDAERMRTGRDREDGGAEHFLFLLHRHADDVVDRQQRPDEQHGRQQAYAGVVERAPECPVVRAAVRALRGHIVTSLRRSWRISRITNGISKGSAVSTVAMPRPGSPSSKALRMPSVASTCVDSAGPPPEMKRTALKSPSAQIVESMVQTRYMPAISGRVTGLNFCSRLPPSTEAASYESSETARRPARKIRVQKGSHF